MRERRVRCQRVRNHSVCVCVCVCVSVCVCARARARVCVRCEGKGRHVCTSVSSVYKKRCVIDFQSKNKVSR